MTTIRRLSVFAEDHVRGVLVGFDALLSDGTAAADAWVIDAFDWPDEHTARRETIERAVVIRSQRWSLGQGRLPAWAELAARRAITDAVPPLAARAVEQHLSQYEQKRGPRPRHGRAQERTRR